MTKLKEIASQLGYLNENDILQKIENGVNAISGGGRRHGSVSDRGDNVKGDYENSMFNHDYGQTDIYIVNSNSKEIQEEICNWCW